MFEKTKKWANENKRILLALAGTTVVMAVTIAASKKIKIKIETTIGVRSVRKATSKELEEELLKPDVKLLDALAENGIESTTKVGYAVPFITKEMAHKAIDILGDTLQIDNYDLNNGQSWAIWISK